jgi:hypothetical protein
MTDKKMVMVGQEIMIHYLLQLEYYLLPAVVAAGVSPVEVEEPAV